MLEVRGLKKHFDDADVLRGISLRISAGEFVTLLGPSGCGKTTTLRIVAGLTEPDEGSVLLDGKDITNLPPEKRDVNTVFQSYALFPHMNVGKNIAYGLRVRGVKKDERARRVEEMLRLVALEGFEKRMPSQLSGGQRQRIAIARALVLGPKLLLLDEPLGALDLKLRQQMQRELKDIQKRLGIAFLYVTHDQEEALNLSDRIAIMRDGLIEQVGAPEDIYERPATRFAAEFIGQSNFLRCEVAEAGEGAPVLSYAGRRFPGRAGGLELRTGDEVELLANSFRKMEEDMISYIRSFVAVTAEKERIGAELNVATQIQADMLPRIFPAFPDREEFDIYATMDPAKEVGGDFYDFFLVDDDHLAMVIADVSGKGVPAALFMVIAKTLIKNHAQNKDCPSAVFTQTNEQLCEGNDAGLFVTAWMGLLEISTGKFTYVNAGHNPPLLKHADGQFEWLKSRPGFVLAGMEGVRYREFTMELTPGDVLYLYTDGVTEATDANQELFGEARLQAALNEVSDLPVHKLLPKIKERIDAFVGEAEQFDDITMLGLSYRNKEVERHD